MFISRPSADLHYSPDETSSILSDNKMLFPTAADSLIVHPGAVLCMLDLLPAIPIDTHDIVSNLMVICLYFVHFLVVIIGAIICSRSDQSVVT